MKKADDRALQEIEKIRAANNFWWMEIMRIAMEAEPAKTKTVLRRINRNDAAISSQLKRLAG